MTVVIPTHDRWSLLPTALGSVLAQEGVTIEVIIVDDASQSPAPPELPGLEDPRVVVERSEVTGGTARARNLGLRLATGRWVAFLDDDDAWAPSKLRRQLHAARPETGFVYCAAIMTDAYRRPVSFKPAPATADLRATLRGVSCIPAGGSNVVVRKGVIGELGGFDEDLWQIPDWDLWIRLAETTTAAACQEPLVAYMQHEASMRVSAPGPSLLGELRHLDRKHRIASAPSARRWFLRWAAEGERRRGRRMRAASLYARSWALYGSRFDLIRAVAEAIGGEYLMAAGRLLEQVEGAPIVGPRAEVAPPAPAWLRKLHVTAANSTPPGPIREHAPSTGQRLDGRSKASALEARIADRTRRIQAAALSLRARLSGRRIGLAVVYHRIATQAGDPAQELLPALSAESLETQLHHFRGRYRPVRASGLLASSRSRLPGGRIPIAITFDDDLRSHLELAAPRLKAEGVPATFFLTGGALHASEGFWWQRLQAAFDQDALPPCEPIGDGATGIHEIAERVRSLPPTERERLTAHLPRLENSGLLDRDQVAELAGAGFEVGFHTLRHDSLSDLPDAALAHALVDGRSVLKGVVGQRMDCIAYPHGRADTRVVAAAHDAGFTTGFTTRELPVTRSTHPLRVGRLDAGCVADGQFELRVARCLAGWPPQVRLPLLSSLMRRLAESERRFD